MAPDSSIRSIEKSFPEPVDLFQVLTSPLLVTLALIVHLFCHRFNVRFLQEKVHDLNRVNNLVRGDAGNGGAHRSTASCSRPWLHHRGSHSRNLGVNFELQGDIKFVAQNCEKVITDALGVGALLGGPPPTEFSFGLFEALAAPAFGLAFWLAVGGGTWPTVYDPIVAHANLAIRSNGDWIANLLCHQRPFLQHLEVEHNHHPLALLSQRMSRVY